MFSWGAQTQLGLVWGGFLIWGQLKWNVGWPNWSNQHVKCFWGVHLLDNGLLPCESLWNSCKSCIFKSFLNCRYTHTLIIVAKNLEIIHSHSCFLSNIYWKNKRAHAWMNTVKKFDLLSFISMFSYAVTYTERENRKVFVCWSYHVYVTMKLLRLSLLTLTVFLNLLIMWLKLK